MIITASLFLILIIIVIINNKFGDLSVEKEGMTTSPLGGQS